MGGVRKYTDEHEEFVLLHYREMHLEDIAKAIGASNTQKVKDLACRLRKKGREFVHDRTRSNCAPMAPIKIRDGYDTVPWFMRQSTRNQAIPDLQYLDLTVD